MPWTDAARPPAPPVAVEPPVLARLREINPDALTPRAALEVLYELAELARLKV